MCVCVCEKERETERARARERERERGKKCLNCLGEYLKDVQTAPSHFIPSPVCAVIAPRASQHMHTQIILYGLRLNYESEGRNPPSSEFNVSVPWPEISLYRVG
jgi:hypothetical protein